MSRRQDGEVRRSQLLFRAGPGALVDLKDHAVVIKGLDHWRYPKDLDAGFDLHEARLEDRALKILRTAGYTHERVRLRRPPECDDEDPKPWVGVPAKEFPNWFLCQGCGSLIRRQVLNKRHQHVCRNDSSKSSPVVPIRFVLSCPKGHLMDVHWAAFIHGGHREEDLDPGSAYPCHVDTSLPLEEAQGNRTSPYYLASLGSSGDLSDQIVGCRRCGKKRGLQQLLQSHNHGRCRGWRPWLKAGSNQDCDAELRLITRTASNAYFPQTLSALSIPSPHQSVDQQVQEFWSVWEDIASLEQLKMLIQLNKQLRLLNLSPEAIWAGIQRRRAGGQQADIRAAEWQALCSAPSESTAPPATRDQDFYAVSRDHGLPKAISQLVLVHKLREVRAQLTFSRLEPVGRDAEGEFDLEGHQVSLLGEHADWIPAIEARGEGIFLAFDPVLLHQWSMKEAVQRHIARFEGLPRGSLAPTSHRALMARMVFLHTLSHLLITQISLEAGYPAASIRERLYCSVSPDPRQSRAGILLSIGTTGAGGTLGGLVEVGRDIARHLREACDRALLCSNDPVCAQHEPGHKHESGRAHHGAACHTCLLIAEPSCERMNLDLDRSLVVPTVHRRDLAVPRDWLYLEP